MRKIGAALLAGLLSRPPSNHDPVRFTMRQNTAARSQSGILRSAAFGLTQICPDSSRILRQNTGTTPHGNAFHSATPRLTQICPDFGWILRQNTGATPHGNTFHSGTPRLTQICGKGGGILCGQGAPQLVHVVFHGPVKELGFIPARDSDSITKSGASKDEGFAF